MTVARATASSPNPFSLSRLSHHHRTSYPASRLAPLVFRLPVRLSLLITVFLSPSPYPASRLCLPLFSCSFHLRLPLISLPVLSLFVASPYSLVSLSPLPLCSPFSLVSPF